MNKIITVYIFSVFFLTACGASMIGSPAEVASQTEVTQDQYTKIYKVTGEKISFSKFPNTYQVRLRGGFKKDDTNEMIQLYIRFWSQTGWSFLDSARDIDGNSLELVKIDRIVKHGGNIEEYVAVNLSREYLQNHIDTGINIRISGSRGNLIIKLPKEYVAGYLMKFKESKTKISSS